MQPRVQKVKRPGLGMSFEWRRTQRCWVKYMKSKNTYAVCTTYRSTKGATLATAEKGGYLSQEEAEKDLLRFRYCVEVKTNWKQHFPNNNTFNADFAGFLGSFADTATRRTALLAQGCAQDQVALSQPLKKQRKAVNKGLPKAERVSTSKFVAALYGSNPTDVVHRWLRRIKGIRLKIVSYKEFLKEDAAVAVAIMRQNKLKRMKILKERSGPGSPNQQSCEFQNADFVDFRGTI